METVGLMYRFDFNVGGYHGNMNPATWFFCQVGTFKGPIVTAAGSILLIISPRTKILFHDIRIRATRSWLFWLLLHGLTIGLFAAASSVISSALSRFHEVSAIQLAIWLGLGGTSLGLWLIAFASFEFWLKLARREFMALLAGGLIGSAIWVFGPLAQSLWLSFSLVDITFWLARHMLGMVYSDVVYDTSARILGTPDYQVEIFPVCSGFEGIALITAFLALYLWAFRKTLRFPNAFLLFPLGVLAIWFANALRIALLVGIGTSLSPHIAGQGFHSQAGWLSFILVAFGLMFLSHRGCFFAAAAASKTSSSFSRNTYEAMALLAPLLALFAATMLASAFSSGFDWLYPVKIVIMAAVLYRFRKVYAGFDWQWSWQASAIGATVFLIWMLLEPAVNHEPSALEEGLKDLPTWQAAVWLMFRVLGSTIAVPLAEELAFRGYLIRKFISTDFENVRLGQFTWTSFLLSSVLFGLLHSRLIAGTLAGIGFALALYRRGRVSDAVIAHATANALIAVVVIGFEGWHLWS
jgi:exosortase E/protease (VPEID-CTERM system)